MELTLGAHGLEKELLERKLDGRAFRYHPQQTRAAFLKSAAAEMVEGYLQDYGQDATTHLSSAVDAVAPRPVSRTSAAPTPESPAPEPQGLEPQNSLSFGKLALAVAVLEGILLLVGRTRRKGH